MNRIWKWVKGIGVGTLALVLVAVLVAVFYYFRTDPETTVVAAGDFPANLSPGFTPEQLVDEVLAAIYAIKDSELKPVHTKVHAQLGPQTASPPGEDRYVSLRVPIAAFEEKVRGVNLGMLRA